MITKAMSSLENTKLSSTFLGVVEVLLYRDS